MCGRYTLFTPPEDIEERFDASFEGSPRPRYNAAPSQSLPVITNDAPETIDTLEWGLIPHWADDRTDVNRPINARGETVAEKRSFRDAYQNRRCLVLADGFYEWQGTGESKQPYRVALESREPFAMAGLWERWQPPQKQTGLDEFGDGRPDDEAEAVETFTIVTTEPNDIVGELHHRMAVVLEEGDERRWLDDGDAELLQPYPTEEMTAYPVSTAVNDPSNDRPELIEEVDAAA
jgi:putative SOS response-associated peptidase YedK